jgi:hypothetical protein
MKAEVWVHSEQGPDATIIDAGGGNRVFDCLNLEQAATIEGFEMRNALGEVGGGGGGVRCENSRLTIRDCVIADCSAGNSDGGGIRAWASDLLVERCRIVGCSAHTGGGMDVSESSVRIAECEILQNEAGASSGGVFAYGPEVTIVGCVVSENVAEWGSSGGITCSSPAVAIQDCLITHNSNYEYPSGALTVYQSSGTIAGCTVANNTGVPTGEGIDVAWESSIRVDRTIIAFQWGASMRCSASSEVAVGCCDIYGNEGGDDLCGTDLGGNFSLDPLFCDPDNGDYTLDGCSPCLPGNHPHGVDCGLIGALGQGCGATAVEETTWGRIKSLYRR